MAVVYDLRIRNQAGQVIATIDQWLGVMFTRTVDDVDAFSLHLDGDDPRALLISDDYQIELWRQDLENGIAWYKEAEGFFCNFRYWTDASGLRHAELSGRGYQDLLARTTVRAAAGTAGASKSGPAETVIKEFVDEQAGPGAGARARTGLTIQADAADGATVNLQRSNRNLLVVCQDIAKVGGGDFDVIGTHPTQAGPATFEFRWYPAQRGTDRSATVIFSEALGNMAEAEVTRQQTNVVNSALVGGQGEGAARETSLQEDALSIALSPWGQRETFVDAREVEAGNTAALDQKGQQALAAATAFSGFTFRPVQTPGCLYGKHYFLGDLVQALYNGSIYIKKIQSVTLANDRGGENVGPALADASLPAAGGIVVQAVDALILLAYYDAAFYDFCGVWLMADIEATVLNMIADLARRVARLETLETASGGNADTVDGIHAAAVATANKLLALDAASKLPASITGDAHTVDGIHAASSATANMLLALDADKDLHLGTGDASATVVTAGDGTNNVVLSNEGVTLEGSATVYDDLVIPISVGILPGANTPAWAVYSTNTKLYTFRRR